MFDGDAEFRMPRLPPIECNLIDAERVGHFLVSSSEERKPSGEVSEFRTIQSGCTPTDAFGDLLRGDASARLGGEFIDTRGDVLTRPQPVPMPSRLMWGTFVPRRAVGRGRAFPACKRFREKFMACIWENRHRRNSTCSQIGLTISQYRRSRNHAAANRPV